MAVGSTNWADLSSSSSSEEEESKEEGLPQRNETFSKEKRQERQEKCIPFNSWD